MYILYTVDVVGLYPSIHHEEGLIAIKKAIDTRKEETLPIDSLIELAECFLRNIIFKHDKSVFKLFRETTKETKMAPPYAIIFMRSLEEDILSKSLLKPLFRWRYIVDIFMIWEHGEWKRASEVFRDSLLPSSYYTVYSKILEDKIKFSGCYCYEKG